jgi:hypothetical protein
MAKKSTNKTIWTLGLVGVMCFLAVKLWPALKKRMVQTSSGGGGVTGATTASSPYYNPYQNPSSSSPQSSIGAGFGSGTKNQNGSQMSSYTESAAKALANGDYTSENQYAIAALYNEQNGYSEGSIPNSSVGQDLIDQEQIGLNNDSFLSNVPLADNSLLSAWDSLWDAFTSNPTTSSPTSDVLDSDAGIDSALITSSADSSASDVSAVVNGGDDTGDYDASLQTQSVDLGGIDGGDDGSGGGPGTEQVGPEGGY